MDSIQAFDPHGDPIRKTAHRAEVGQVVLFDPINKALTWGEDSDIQFGPKGGFEEHFAVVDADHPKLGQLLRDQPQIKPLEDGPAAVIVCSECGQEFTSRAGFANHNGQKHGKKSNISATRTGPLMHDEPYPQDDPKAAERDAMQRELNENIKWLRAQQETADAKEKDTATDEAAPVSLTEQPQPAPRERDKSGAFKKG